MGSTTVRSGSATVTVSGVDASVRAATRPLISTVRDELRLRLTRVVEAARARWPVLTGRSRDALRLVESESSEGSQTGVRNEVAYAGEVHPRRMRALSWDELVVGPTEGAARDAELALPGRLEREIQRAVDRS